MTDSNTSMRLKRRVDGMWFFLPIRLISAPESWWPAGYESCCRSAPLPFQVAWSIVETTTSRRGDSPGSARTRSHDLNFSHCGTLMARDPKIYGVIVDRAALDGPAKHTIKSLFTTIDDTVKIIFQGNGGGGSPPPNRFSSPCSRGACTRRSMKQPSWTSRRAWMSGCSLESAP